MEVNPAFHQVRCRQTSHDPAASKWVLLIPVHAHNCSHTFQIEGDPGRQPCLMCMAVSGSGELVSWGDMGGAAMLWGERGDAVVNSYSNATIIPVPLRIKPCVCVLLTPQPS